MPLWDPLGSYFGRSISLPGCPGAYFPQFSSPQVPPRRDFHRFVMHPLLISSGLLIPFMAWFIINLVPAFDANNSQLIDFASSISTKILMSIFIILAFTFYTLTISEVFEDYINNLKLKNAANRLLVLFSIIITLVLLFFLIKI